MNSMNLRSRVGADGVLDLKVPAGVSDAEVEVVAVFQLIEPAQALKAAEERGWPADFFEQTMLIGPYDMMTAAITLPNDLTLLTYNTASSAVWPA